MENFEQEEKYSNEKIVDPEGAFEALVFNTLIEDYKNDLKEAGFSDEDVFDFLMIVTSYKHEDRSKILSIPFELRKRQFIGFFNRFANKEIDMKDVVKEIYETSEEFSFGLGFHTTPYEIKKGFDKRGNQTWNVEGSENDHRDDDLRMAYYSRDFENIYTQKTFEHIYIIRAKEEHKNDTKWYRAPTLPIISGIDMNSAELQKWFLEYQQEQERQEREDTEEFGDKKTA
jgi:hypothetical protein